VLFNGEATLLLHSLDEPFYSLTGKLGNLTTLMAQQVVAPGAVSAGVAVTVSLAVDATGQS
jgi:hypothetical protein